MASREYKQITKEKKMKNTPSNSGAQHTIQERAVQLITSQNSEVDNVILMNKVNMLIAKTPKIASMGPEVIAQAVLKAMIPDPTLEYMNDIYFIPYGKTIDVSFSHNYLQKLAYRNGAVRLINTHLVFENDIVEVTENGLSYKILPFKPHGEFVGVLVDVVLKNREHKYGMVTKEHIDQARKASKAGNAGAWRDWYYEMAKKVAIKNTLKSVNISKEFEDAVSIDNEDTDFELERETDADKKMTTSLEEKMRKGSDVISSISDMLTSVGASFEIRENWVIIDTAKSEEGSLDALEARGIKLVNKKDDPNLCAFKVSEETLYLEGES